MKATVPAGKLECHALTSQLCFPWAGNDTAELLAVLVLQLVPISDKGIG